MNKDFLKNSNAGGLPGGMSKLGFDWYITGAVFSIIMIVAYGCYITFSNSLIIHQVKTKEITTVKEVWIPGLN